MGPDGVSLTSSYDHPLVALPLPNLLKSGILAAAYYAIGDLSLSLGLVSPAEVLLWLPMGIGLAVLVLHGLRTWPGILVGSFLLSIRSGIPMGGALGASLAIVGESLLCAYLLSRRIRIHNSLARVRDILSLFGLAGLVSPLTGSLVGACSYCLAGLFPWSQFARIWSLWWGGEAMAILVAAPVYLTWGANHRLAWTRRRGIEALVFATWLLFGNVLVFSRWPVMANLRFPSPALPFFLRIWAALRFGPRGVTAANLLVVLLASRATWGGFGPLIGQTVIQSVLFFIAYAISTSAVSTLLAAVICEREQVTERLTVSEDRYRDLVEHSEDLICTHDLQGRILSINKAAAMILGCEPNEVLKKSVRDFLAPEVQDKFNDYLATIRVKGAAQGFMVVLTKTGERRVWEYRNTLRRDGVASPIVRGMAHDITQRRQAEEELRRAHARTESVLSSVADVHILFDRNWHYLYVNEAAVRAIARSREHILGRTLWEIYPDILSTELERQYRRTMEHRIPVTFNFYYSTRATWWENRFYPTPEGLAVFATEITKRKRAEEALRRLSGRILHLQDEARRKIARDLHDSTGQNLVALASALGQLHTSGRKSRHLVSECQALANQCIREVRTLSYALHPPMLDETGLEDAIRHYLKGFAKRSGIRVDFEVSPDCGRLRQDVELNLFRVIQESLTNIQRHSGSPQAKIRIVRDSDKVILEVIDKGRGFPSGSRATNGKLPLAAGVGIASMRERAKQIGGRLEIESGSAGTTVRVTVPAGDKRHEETPRVNS